MDIRQLFQQNEGARYTLHDEHLNEHYVRRLAALGYSTPFQSGKGPYLYDRDGVEYLDLMAGVFAIGRNHPTLRDALKSALDGDFPNLVQTDVSVFAGVLARRLLSHAPYLDRVFFANSGTEVVEAAIKFARAATNRTRLISCNQAFHGLTYGSLSLNGTEAWQTGFGPLLPDCIKVPFNDLSALEHALNGDQAAAFFVEPIQGAEYHVPSDEYLKSAAELCRKHGTLFVVDEVLTGLGRTGRFFAIDHWGVEPDMILLSKALSGGFVPVGALLTRQRILDQVVKHTGRAVPHGSTFSKNDLAMIAALATLDVLETERLPDRAARLGKQLLADLVALAKRHEFVASVRGKGLMIAIELGAPRSLKLRAAWSALETARKGLFSLLVTGPLFKDHKLITKATGAIITLTPALVISEVDCWKIVQAFELVLAQSEQISSSVWSLGMSLVSNQKTMRQLFDKQPKNEDA